MHFKPLSVSRDNDNNNENNCRTLLHESNAVHKRNLQFLVTEIYKLKNDHASPIMKLQLFQLRGNTFNLRNFRELSTQEKKT